LGLCDVVLTLAQLRALLFYRFSHTFVRVRMLKHNSLSCKRREGPGGEFSAKSSIDRWFVKKASSEKLERH